MENKPLLLLIEAPSLNTLRIMSMVLQEAEHERRNVRTDKDNPLNLPYKELNKIGEMIEKTLAEQE